LVKDIQGGTGRELGKGEERLGRRKGEGEDIALILGETIFSEGGKSRGRYMNKEDGVATRIVDKKVICFTISIGRNWGSRTRNRRASTCGAGPISQGISGSTAQRAGFRGSRTLRDQ